MEKLAPKAKLKPNVQTFAQPKQAKPKTQKQPNQAKDAMQKRKAFVGGVVVESHSHIARERARKPARSPVLSGIDDVALQDPDKRRKREERFALERSPSPGPSVSYDLVYSGPVKGCNTTLEKPYLRLTSVCCARIYTRVRERESESVCVD